MPKALRSLIAAAAAVLAGHLLRDHGAPVPVVLLVEAAVHLAADEFLAHLATRSE